MAGPHSENPMLLLGQRLREMSEASARLAQAEHEWLVADRDANLHEWTTFLEGTGSIENRKVEAKKATAAMRFAADEAEGKVVFLRREFRIADKRVDVGRTFSADLRAELKVLGQEPGTWT